MSLIVSAGRPAVAANEAPRAGALLELFPLRPWRFRRIQVWRGQGRAASVLVRVSARPGGCQAQVWLGHLERARLKRGT